MASLGDFLKWILQNYLNLNVEKKKKKRNYMGLFKALCFQACSPLSVQRSLYLWSVLVFKEKDTSWTSGLPTLPFFAASIERKPAYTYTWNMHTEYQVFWARTFQWPPQLGLENSLSSQQKFVVRLIRKIQHQKFGFMLEPSSFWGMHICHTFLFKVFSSLWTIIHCDQCQWLV